MVANICTCVIKVEKRNRNKTTSGCIKQFLINAQEKTLT